jgi:hypothetical protein
VSASSAIVAHAAVRADGTLGILVANTQAPGDGSLPPIDVPITLLGDTRSRAAFATTTHRLHRARRARRADRGRAT